MDGRPNRRNKAAILNFSGVLWTLPRSHFYHKLNCMYCQTDRTRARFCFSKTSSTVNRRQFS